MLVVGAPDHAFKLQLLPLLHTYSPIVATDPVQFASLAMITRCGVLHLHDLEGPWFQSLITIRDSGEANSIVLIVGRETGTIRQLNDLKVHVVLWENELASGLKLAVDRVIREAAWMPFDVAPSGAWDSDATIKRAVSMALSAQPPYRTVNQWCRAIGCNRRTLWTHWRAVVTDFTPKCFLDRVLRARALELRMAGHRWADVSARLSVPAERLARIARRLRVQARNHRNE